MKYIFLKKRRLPVVFYMVIFMLILSTISLNFAVTGAMAQQWEIPIYRVENADNYVAITMNIDGYINLEKLKEISNGAKITLLLSEYYCLNYCNDIAEMAQNGYCLGILDRSMKGLKRKQINDILAYRVENLALMSKKNPTLVRFENNLYDATCVKATYDSGLNPVQWACDASADNYTSGDIILVKNLEEMKNVIKKTKSAGFRIVSVEDLLNNEKTT